MRKILILLLLFLQTLVVFGQINIKIEKGFIISSQNDTIYGDIFVYPTDYLSYKVKFIQANGNEIEYKPNDLNGFHIEPDKDFVVLSIKEKIKKNTINTKYFALKLVKGEVELIVLYLNNEKERFFINSSDFGLTELHQIIETKNGIKKTENKYLIELGKYFYKHPGSPEKIRETNFHYKSLTNLIADYNLNFEKPSSSIKNGKFNWHAVVNIGMDYNLNNKIENTDVIPGMVFGFKNSFYNNEKNLKLEFVVGLNYRLYSLDENLVLNYDTNGIIMNNPLIVTGKNNITEVYNIPNQLGYGTVYRQETVLYKQRAEVIEMPIYIEYNNKLKLISPIVQAGVKPYLVKVTNKLDNIGTYESDWDYHGSVLFGLGVSLNYWRLSLKYVVHADPFLLNTLELNFRLN